MGFFSSLFGLNSKEDVFQDTTGFVILDVRTPAEFQDGHVQGALNIDLTDSQFVKKIAKLDKKKTYKLYCRSGNRSGQATRQMKSMGFTDVENLGSLSQASRRLQKSID